jgi:hypothetical protein
MDVIVPGADWLTKIVTLGPPVLLVIGLLIILQAGARDKIDIKKTAILSGIVAAFFGLWIFALPELRTRRVIIETSMPSQEILSSYSLRPVQYQIVAKEAKDADLDNNDFDFPSGADTLRMRFNLQGLLQSYKDNLRTIIYVAQNDKPCFENAIRGNTPWGVAAEIKKMCPGTVQLAPEEAP